MWEGAVKGGGDPSLGLETHESGLGTHGLQGEGMDVALDVCVVDGMCVVVGIIVVIGDGACHCCDTCDMLLPLLLPPRARVLSGRKCWWQWLAGYAVSQTRVGC